MKKVCPMGLFVFLFLTGSCFAATVNWIELETHYDGTNFELWTIADLDDPDSNTISYSVDSDGPYLMPLKEVFGYYLGNMDNVTTTLGGNPLDYNGKYFTWIVENQDGWQMFGDYGIVSGLRQVAMSTNLTIDDDDPLNPTISWSNPDLYLDLYRVRLFDPSHNLLDQWDVALENPSFTFPDDTLQPGQEYIIRIEARDYESFDFLNPLSGLDECLIINRSDLEITYTAPVPIPTTLLLLGSGLVGLAGFRRKSKKT